MERPAELIKSTSQISKAAKTNNRVTASLSLIVTASLMIIALTVGSNAKADSIASGSTHYCAVTNSLGAVCYGKNNFGQLGNGETSSTIATVPCYGTGQLPCYDQLIGPVAVAGYSGAVAAVSTGSDYACALMVGGGVSCWGANAFGQLGNGTTLNSATPVAVTGLTGVVALAAGGESTCALTSAGGVVCWGDNTYGELGNGTTAGSKIPVAVSGLASGVIAVASGQYEACAVKSSGAVLCWGFNQYGQLGNGTTANSTTPVVVSGISTAIAVTLGKYFACATLSSGSLKCWGLNSSGQLGNGATTNSSTPVAVSGLASGVVTMSAQATSAHACAITTAGSLLCWGLNSSGQLGIGSKTNSSTPVVIPGFVASSIPNQQILGIGASNSCAIDSAGAAWCWGENSYGELGNGTTSNSSVPVQNGLKGINSASGAVVAAIALTSNSACGVVSTGALYCWGNNEAGQVGAGNTTNLLYLSPSLVIGFGGGIGAVTAGDNFSCALTMAGTVICWGDNTYGQTGNAGSSKYLTPVLVTGLSSSAIGIAAGDNHACALIYNGTVQCWGLNSSGQLGNGTTINSATPVAVNGITGSVVAIAAGGGHTCAVTNSGATWCWGLNSSGQLGNGTITNSLTPVAVPAMTAAGGQIVGITTGENHTCAVSVYGVVVCWGLNSRGQLGNNNQTSATSPVHVVGNATPARQIAATANGTCALTFSGAEWCWGDDSYGEDGDGTDTGPPFLLGNMNSDYSLIPVTLYRLMPVPVNGLASGVVGLGSGRGSFAAAIANNGVAYQWGDIAGGTDANGFTIYFWPAPSPFKGLTANTIGLQGNIRLKYKVVGVFYAPPGARSTATYGGSFTGTTTTSTMLSNTSTSSVQDSLAENFTYGIFSDKNSQDISQSWATQKSSTDAVALTTISTQSYVVAGPSNSLGVDHSQDIIWIWLNPSLMLNVFPAGPSPVGLQAVNFDARDPVDGVDIYPLTVAQLTTIANGGTLPTNQQVVLNRTWSTKGPITAADALAILSTDPFAATPNFNPTTDTSGRYDPAIQAGTTCTTPPCPVLTVSYAPSTVTTATNYSVTSGTTTTVGQTATSTYTTTVDDITALGVKGSFDIYGVKFGYNVTNTLKLSNTLTDVNQYSSTTVMGSTKTAALTIYTPLISDSYTGPTQINVYKDNVYGTYMFWGVLQDQVITFNAIPAQEIASSPITVSATSNSMLPVSFSSSTLPVCTVSGANGSIVTLLMPGLCEIAANQAGSSLFSPAPTVTQAFNVLPSRAITVPTRRH
jgi:alpha-tubulin suppressor-like RCC1 family protein